MESNPYPITIHRLTSHTTRRTTQMLSNNPVVADAVALAKQAANDSLDAATHLLTKLADDAQAELPKIASDAVANVIEFVPQQYRPFVLPFAQTILAGALPKVEEAAANAIKTGLGFAIQRIQALHF